MGYGFVLSLGGVVNTGREKELLKYNVMWLRVLLVVSMEDSLLVIVQSTDLLKDGRVTGEESPVLPHHSVRTMLRTSLAHLHP